jgi:tetratricopeptide (TPR) repeat protein
MEGDIADFPLHLKDSGTSSYSVRLVDPSRADLIESSFRFFEEIQLVPAYLRRALAFPRRDTFLGTTLCSVGGKLHDGLFSGKVGREFAKLKKEGKKIAVSLEIESRELSPLPWELMNDGGRFLFEDPDVYLSRRPSLAREPRFGAFQGLLHLAVLLAAPRTEDPYDMAAEESLFASALDSLVKEGKIKYSVERLASFDKLSSLKLNRRPDAIHLVLRGEFSKVRDRSMLFIGPDEVETQQAASALARIPGVRFAVFSVPVSNARRNPAVYRLADYFLAEAAGGALTAGYPFAGEEWAAFYHTLYESLADGDRLDDAAGAARRVASSETGLSAGMPILFQHDPDVFRASSEERKSLIIHAEKMKTTIQSLEGAAKALALGELAACMRKSGKRTEAAELFLLSAPLFGESGEKYNQAVAYQNCAAVLMADKKYGEAAEILKKCLALRRETSVQDELVVVLNKLGYCMQKLGSLDEALECFEEATEIARASPDRRILANCLYNLGVVSNKIGLTSDAEVALGEAAKIQDDLKDMPSLVDTLTYIGAIYLHENDFKSAVTLYGKCLPLQREIGDVSGVAMSYNNLGSAYQRLGRLDEAYKAYWNALDIFEKTGNLKGVAGSYHNLAVIYSRKRDLNEAIFYALKAIQVSEKNNLNEVKTVSDKLLDEFAAALGRDEYRTKYYAAMDRLKKIGR